MINWILTNKQWLFSGIGVTIIGLVILIVKKMIVRKEIPSSNNKIEELKNILNSGVVINDKTNNTGIIVGHDLHIYNEPLNKNLDELIEILNMRAIKIKNELAIHYKYIKIDKYLEEFTKLHEKHIAALKSGQVILAHEILNEIKRISYNIENDEFWARHKIETPDLLYCLNDDAFTRGFLICEYVVGDMKKHSPKYQDSVGYVCVDGSVNKSAKDIYKLIYESEKNSIIGN